MSHVRSVVPKIGRCGYSIAVVGILNHKCQRMISIIIENDRDVIKIMDDDVCTPLDRGAKPLSFFFFLTHRSYKN
jgi:hypothetical protein